MTLSDLINECEWISEWIVWTCFNIVNSKIKLIVLNPGPKIKCNAGWQATYWWWNDCVIVFCSKLPYDVTPEQAMSHEEVRTRLEASIKNMRTVTDKFLSAIIVSLDKIPWVQTFRLPLLNEIVCYCVCVYLNLLGSNVLTSIAVLVIFVLVKTHVFFFHELTNHTEKSFEYCRNTERFLQGNPPCVQGSD